MMRGLAGRIWACLLLGAAPIPAAASDCPGNPDALGTSRIIEVDPSGGPLYGTYQYPATLDLKAGEVVLTFDDGPHPFNTTRILAALKAQCVRATFFAIGRLARKYPKVLRSVASAGHTIGGHTWSHPSHLGRLRLSAATAQIERGFDAIRETIGRPAAPFLRFPGLNDTPTLQGYAAERGYAVVSADIATDDWTGISPRAIARRTLARLRRRGSGIVIFHDTKSATAAALPWILKALKSGGYRVVHIVPEEPFTPQPRPNPPKSTTPVASNLADGTAAANTN